MGTEPVEESSAFAEKDWDERNLEHIKPSCTQECLRGRRAVQHDIPITGCPFRPIDTRFHALGHEVDATSVRAGGGVMRQNEDRHAVVMVAVPVVGEVCGASAGDHGTGRHHLVENRSTWLVARSIARRIVAAALGQPVVQTLAPVAEAVALRIPRAGDETVQRHRHVQHDP